MNRSDLIAELGFLCLGSRFRRLGERLQAGVAEVLRQQGIGVQPAQIPLLDALGEGTMTVGALVERLDLSQPGVTRSLGKLAADGLVAIVPGKSDQRQREVCLTPQGKALLERLHAELFADVEDAVAGLCEGPAGGLLVHLDRLDAALAQEPLAQRIATARARRTA